MQHAVAAPARSRSRSRGAHVVEGLTIAAIAVALAGALVAQSDIGASTVSARHLAPIRVESGDTLWDIASEHPVPGQTTEQTVDLIREINHLEDGLLYAGQVIRVPTADDPSTAVAAR